MTFDYELPAEVFMTKRKRGARSRLGYRRFATAAEAIRFVVEEFPALRTLGPWMQVGDARYDSEDIRRLYESGDYPSVAILAEDDLVLPAAATRTDGST
jgi:hypothetical protein